MARRWTVGLTIAGLLLITLDLGAHVGNHPSVHDTVAGIIQRVVELPRQARERLTPRSVWETLLTEEERHILSTEHISFRVNVPVTLYVLRDQDLKEEPFWLTGGEFEKTDWTAVVDGDDFDIWKRDYPAGWIGLGVNAIGDEEEHYLVVVVPQEPGANLEISDLYPGYLDVTEAKPGASAYVDDEDEKVERLPEALIGQRMIRTAEQLEDDANLWRIRVTNYPASREPDQIVLTWSEDPRTTQTIQWRTSTAVTRGVVQYQKKAAFLTFQPQPPQTVEAKREVLETPNIANDPVCHRFTATLRNLEPGTTYVYTVGDGTPEGTSPLMEFTTAPDEVRPFSFIYMGDAQNGLDRWGSLIHTAFRLRPDAAFYLMAGDLVNRGNDRDDWDSFFYNAGDIFAQRPLVPVIGNHECQGGHPTLYLKLFDLPDNAPETVETERVYAFRYSNALFIVLDSNLSPTAQVEWLDRTLQEHADATWKFVSYHHPAYSSHPRRDNTDLRAAWVPIFDKHHVDVVLQGHDHAYLRTYPMRNNEVVSSPSEGTIYVVSVSGTKMYDQADRYYKEVGFTNVSTYQVLDIQLSNDRLHYRAYDLNGNLRDEFEIVKSQ
ncbi:MAG: hypothetical protein KatS3mg115_0506 [Candidatus Poribacteria bacterium]|nr:MAG: hypothetical protein KatS3mg115_0506 [Candidatus Poribacteria bacterium]